MARRELGTRGRLAALGGAVALLLALAVVVGGSDGDEEERKEIGPLRAANFIEALADAGIEVRAGVRAVLCGRATSAGGAAEHYRPGGRFWLQEWASADERESWVPYRRQVHGYTRHSCMAETCIEWVFWNANLVLTADSVPSGDTTTFEPAADPERAPIVEVFLALEPSR